MCVNQEARSFETWTFNICHFSFYLIPFLWQPVVAAAPVTVKIEPVEEITPTASREDSPAPSECMDKIPVFKNKNFVVSYSFRRKLFKL